MVPILLTDPCCRQFIESLIEYLKAQPLLAQTFTTTEKSLRDIFSDPNHPRRMLFHHRFQDFIYNALIMMDEEPHVLTAACSSSHRYTSTISTYMFPLLHCISKRLIGIMRFNSEVHFDIHTETLNKIIASRPF